MNENRDPDRASGDHTPPSNPAPETLEGFSDWHQIGRGGDAIVYRAIQDSLGREVAVKVLTLDDDESVRRFTREVRLMVSLGRRHPNIAKVIQIGTSSLGRPCIVMEYYELGSLDQRLSRTGPLSADEVIRVGIVIADALDFAHANGVLHRDVKPQNILVLPTSYVLADFGIARVIDSAHTASADRFSYRHASPQVLDGLAASESDDVFSLGATMFHLLDGKPPFTTSAPGPDSALAYIKRVRLSEPRRLSRPDLPAELVALIERCLRKDPTERFRTAAEVRDQLTTLVTSRPDPAGGTPEGPAEGPRRPAFTAAATTPSPPWGIAAGHVSDPDDLTAMRLAARSDGPTEAPGAAPGAQAPAAAVAPDRGRWRVRVRPWSVLAAGIVAGVALAVTVTLLTTSPERPGPGTPSAAPAQTPATTRNNPDLAPRNMRITISGNVATATWRGAIEDPEAYAWGVTAHPEDQPAIERMIRADERTAEVGIDPSWDQVCFTVIGMRGGQFGATHQCATR